MNQDNKRIDAYIEAYKELERCVKPKYGSVLDYEKTLSQEEGSKLQLCRIIRNHIQHTNEKGFVAITSDMQSFIEKKIQDVKSEDGILKEFITSTAKYGFISEDMTVIDAATHLLKKNRTRSLVLNKKNEIIGYFSKFAISDVVGEGLLTKSLKVGKLAAGLDHNYDIKFCDGNMPMIDVKAILEKKPDTIFVVKTGAGKIVGLYNYRV